MDASYMSAQQAADALGVSLATLYAYVSRGYVRSEAEGASRTRRYRGEDIRVLVARKLGRRDPEGTLEGALHWGTPILESALSLIEDGKLYYRGQDAAWLARHRTFEEVASLLWSGEWPHCTDAEWDDKPVRRLPFMQAAQVALAQVAASDAAACDLRTASVMRAAAHAIRLLAAVACHRRRCGQAVAATLERAWGVGARGLVDAALILCADHELNVSAFTARCVASARATPYAVLQAGLAALGGFRHGGCSDRVESMLLEAAGRSRKHRADVIRERLRRGEEVPGFGHSLYADGDPRARCLLEMVAERFPRSAELALSRTLVEQAADLMGSPPNIDLALVTLRRVLGLPAGSALTLFALGRSAGWIAHAIEQYQDARMIRPRARYVGAAAMGPP